MRLEGDRGRGVLAGAGSRRFPGLQRRLGAHDGAFYQEVVRPADHQQMLDVVPAHDHELTVAIEVIGVDDAQSGLTGAPAAAAHAGPEETPVHHDEDEDDGQRGGERQKPSQHPVAARQIIEKLHLWSVLACALAP